MIDFINGPLAPLAAFKQFIIWQMRQVMENGKPVWKKYPTDYRQLSNPSWAAQIANAHDPAIHLTAADAQAIAARAGKPYGLGFSLSSADPFVFIDLDKCYNPTTQQWKPEALALLRHFPGAAVEVSQSHTGLHIIASASAVPPHGCKDGVNGFEMYHNKRFIALTGINAVGSAAADCTATLPAVVARYFNPSAAGAGDATVAPGEWTTAPVAGYSSVETDEELIARAMRSASAGAVFGGKASFADLWGRNVAVLGAAFPDVHQDPPREFDPSRADSALAQHLSFWTGGNCERIRALMMQSGLVRDKWGRDGYIRTTISGAVGRSRSFYSVRTAPDPSAGPVQAVTPGAVVPAAPTGTLTVSTTSGYQYLTAQAQLEHFKGCVYVTDMHKIFTPSGDFLNSDRFNAVYGGYVFALDNIDDKSTRAAWEAFTQSQANRFPKVNTSCFRPDRPSGEIAIEEGRSRVNVYVPVPVRTVAGDPAPFLDLLQRMLPVKNDRDILLSYMAACVQYKGVKFQWAPLIQGAEGNGKTVLTRCVRYAVGKRYGHLPKAMDIDNKFNGWILNKLFIGVEDVFVPDHRREIMETLKPMITGGDGLDIQFKGQDQITADICANFIFNSNHPDAIKKTRNDRRFAIFFCAQQSEEDIRRDGMSGAYFPALYDWLKADGYAIVADFLSKYDIKAELNPATLCHRAPETSSTEEAIDAGLGSVEQLILEAVDEGETGFRGGWISSIALERLLSIAGKSRAVPPRKRRDLLRSIGYDWHPALLGTCGRANNPIPIDGNKKPRLFVKAGIAAHVKTPADACRLYISAQEPPAPVAEGVPMRGVG